MSMETLTLKKDASGNLKVQIPDQLREFKLNLKLDRNETGKIIGYTVTPGKQGEAEFFCNTFTQALSRKKGEMQLEGYMNEAQDLISGAIILTNGCCPFQPAIVKFPITRAELVELDSFTGISRGFQYENLRPASIGFQIRFD